MKDNNDDDSDIEINDSNHLMMNYFCAFEEIHEDMQSH